MFIGNFTKYLPYWKYHQNKTEITYREYFDIKTKIHLEKKTIKILNLNKISFIKKYFDQNYLKMFFKFILIKNEYIQISDNYIAEKLLKKKNNFNPYLSWILKIKFIFKNFFFGLGFLINNSQPNEKDNENNYDILVQFFHGGKDDKLDFPDEEFLKKKKVKILTLFDYHFPSFCSQSKTQKGFKEDFIYIKNKNFKNKANFFKLLKPSSRNKKLIKNLFKVFIFHPYYASILMNYIYIYELYYQIFSLNKIRVFVHGKTMDSEIAPIRNACDNLNVLNINYSRSYLPNRFNDVLSQPDELVFYWGYNMNNHFDKKINNIKYLVNSEPYFKELAKNNLKRKNYNKIVSVFDSSFDIDTAFSNESYLEMFSFITKYIYENKNCFLLIKHKWPSLGKRVLNEKYLNMLIKEKRVEIFDKSYSNNNDIILNSDLVVCFGSFSVGAEALYNGVDSISLLANSYKNKLISKINSIYPVASKDKSKFQNMFLDKMSSKSDVIRISNLKNYFFSNENKKKSHDIIFDYLSEIKKEKNQHKHLVMDEILNGKS